MDTIGSSLSYRQVSQIIDLEKTESRYQSFVYRYGSLMVWTKSALTGRTYLYLVDCITVIALRYRDDILAHYVRPFHAATDSDSDFMKDNARDHFDRIVPIST